MHKFVMYSPLHSWKKGEYPVSPFVAVAVGDHATSNDGHLLLTAELVNNTEIDIHIDGLIAELEEFRRTAKSEIKKLQAKMLAK